MIILAIIGAIILLWLGWYFYKKNGAITAESDRDKAIRLFLQATVDSDQDGYNPSASCVILSAMPYSVNAPDIWHIKANRGEGTMSATVDLKEGRVSDISWLV